MFTFAHCFVSPDGSHDTFMVQHCFKALTSYFDSADAAELIGPGWKFPKLDSFYVSTDGAASHFKSRFTLFSLFELFEKRRAMWQFCAPGHGKGPWDGICAVIKNLLRRKEKNSEAYMSHASEVFLELRHHYKDWKSDAALVDGIFGFFIWYVAGPRDTTVAPGLFVLPCVKRPKVRPEVTKIDGVRSKYFCFRTSTQVAGLMHCRPYSCHCESCCEGQWAKCENKDAGEWKAIQMSSTRPTAGIAANPKSSRSSMSRTRDTRRSTARKALVGQFVALQRAGDDGLSWWLARVTKVAHCAPTNKNVNAFQIQKGGYYLKVQHYDHLGDYIFKQSTLEGPVMIDAEGLFHNFTSTQYTQDQEETLADSAPDLRRSARGHASSKASAAAKPSTWRVKVLSKIAEEMSAIANAYIAMQ
jgi:hypothetical protein